MFWNGGAWAVLGYSASRVVGQKCYEVMAGLEDSGLTLDCAGWCACMRYARVGFRTSGWDREPDGGALVFEGGRELHRIWTVDRKLAGARVDLEFPAWLLAFQEGGPKTDFPGGIAGARGEFLDSEPEGLFVGFHLQVGVLLQ